jgi:hypothetical protein
VSFYGAQADNLAMRRLLFLIALLLSPLAGAQSPVLDYTARIPIESDTAETRQLALRAALAEVLLRVSGAPANPRLLDQAQEWVLHFGVDRDEVGLGLRAGFDGRAIDRALRAEGLPVWGAFEGDLMSLPVILAGLQRPEQLGELLRRLGSHPQIRSVGTTRLEADRLELRIATAAGAFAVDEALRGFARAESPDPASGALRYRLQ